MEKVKLQQKIRRWSPASYLPAWAHRKIWSKDKGNYLLGCILEDNSLIANVHCFSHIFKIWNVGGGRFFMEWDTPESSLHNLKQKNQWQAKIFLQKSSRIIVEEMTYCLLWKIKKHTKKTPNQLTDSSIILQGSAGLFASTLALIISLWYSLILTSFVLSSPNLHVFSVSLYISNIIKILFQNIWYLNIFL